MFVLRNPFKKVMALYSFDLLDQILNAYLNNSSGRIEDVVLKEVRGKMDKKRALVYLKDNLKLLRYEPIVIDGESHSLTGLQGLTGWNIIEKGM